MDLGLRWTRGEEPTTWLSWSSVLSQMVWRGTFPAQQGVLRDAKEPSRVMSSILVPPNTHVLFGVSDL